MELIKDNWKKSDLEEFQEYLKTFENNKNKKWATNLLKTSLPVLCMKSKDIKNIVKEISKGNYLNFLDSMLWEYYENTAINGTLINTIKDFGTMKKYLDIYSSKADNWATCDLLTFNIKNNQENYLKLSNEYIKSEKPFVKRIGIYILFNFIDDEHIDMILKVLDSFQNEENYYVNMMNAWLLSELFIKQRTKTLKYLEKNKLNKFTLNKGIQKCRESNRVNKEDKDMLLKYKIKR